MSRTRLFIGAAFGVLAMAVTSAPALAIPPAVVFQSPAEAEAMDLALVAKAKGWTVEQARARRDAAERLGRVQEAVAARMPDAFVGGVLASTPGGTSTLLVKGEATAYVRELVAAAGIPIAVVDRQPYSFAELEARSSQIHKQLATAGYRDIGTAVDITRARVLATVSARPGLPSTASAVSAALPAGLRAGTNLTVVDGPVGTDLQAFGGMLVQNTAVTTVCTSGWSVVEPVFGITGVTTAGHCQGITEIVDPGPNPDLVQVFNLVTEHRGEFGDVEWHTTPGTTATDDFYITPATIRDVASVEPRANITVGEEVCVYGRASNSRDCTTNVLLTSASCTVDGVFNDRLVAMDGTNNLIGGDSGGGYSFANTAYGSAKGFCNFQGARRAMWSVADLYDEALGVSVLT